MEFCVMALRHVIRITNIQAFSFTVFSDFIYTHKKKKKEKNLINQRTFNSYSYNKSC